MLVPFAASSAEGCRAALGTLALPHLERLLARLAPAEVAGGGETTLSMPHEAALAREAGLAAPDGLLPLAAWEQAQAGQDPGDEPCAWITPCHWQVGADHIVLHDPRALQLEAGESQQLLAAMAPYFEQDGLRLAYAAPLEWVARGPLFAEVPCASLDRVAGRVLDTWIPRSAAARPLRRLQQEMQMLLYTHPVNDSRAARGLPPVNSFWASGCGALPRPRPRPPSPPLQVAGALRGPALSHDWAAWTAAWQQLDAQECAMLGDRLARGEPVAVTLAGERRARTWRSAGAGWARRMAALLARPRPQAFLSDL